MKKLLLILIALPMIGFGQNVNIPDANFKAYLVGNSLINTNGDAEIQVSEATAFSGSIDCNSNSIYNLTGIEDFTALDFLGCANNQLTSLDVSFNTALTGLACDGNQLTSLNVSFNTALTTYLNCGNNQLSILDLSNNTALTGLFCGGNQLTSLDVSNNTSLYHLSCSGNTLTSLDLRNGNNYGMFLNAQNNPNLYCINVDDAANWTVANGNIDPQHYFSNNCSGTSVEEHTTNKEILKVTDLLGRETKQTNQPLFYIYDDETVEKKIVIE